MKVLVINAGSSSLKYQLIDTTDESVAAKGICERIGTSGAILKHDTDKRTEISKPMPTHKEAIQIVLDALVDPNHGVIKSMNEICAVGHRVVHSGETFTDSVKITPKVLAQIAQNTDMAPLHMPANIMGIEACQAVMPKVPMVAVFDTAFHSTMPPKAYMYAIPYDAYTEYKVRKYGFHGTSHMFVAQEAAKLMGREDDKDFKVIVCHFGNGASVSAVKGGKCLDTSMGLTPLQGLMMGTRCGDIDPAVIEYLALKKGISASSVTDYLNKESGVLGISGVSSDFRDLEKAADEGNERAKLAIDMFSYRVKKYIGSYAAVLGGLDCLVFTAGVGEHTHRVRDYSLEGLEFLGIELNKKYNYEVERGAVSEISMPNSKTKVYIIPTNEELVIARETVRLSK